MPPSEVEQLLRARRAAKTAPSGFDGELTISTRVRAVTRVSSSSMLGRNPRSGVSEYGTGCASSIRAFIVKVV